MKLKKTHRLTVWLLCLTIGLYPLQTIQASPLESSSNTLAATITGTVTGESGEPLIGATVVVKGTTTGAVTDLDGAYTIEAGPDDVLLFSYTGYSEKEVEVRNQSIGLMILKLEH